MKYDQIIGQAPATNAELFKAAVLAALADVERRLDALEPKSDKKKEPNGS